MRRIVTTALVLVAALVAVPQSADAQTNAPARDGFFIGLGLGGGSFGCTDCGDRQSGVSGHLKLGTAVSEQLLLFGMRRLEEVLRERHEVVVCAPDREQSASSHSLSTNSPEPRGPTRRSGFLSLAGE